MDFYFYNSTAMFIHEAFKDELKTVIPELQERLGITNIDGMPNGDIISKLATIFTDESNINTNRFMDEVGEYTYINRIFSEVTSIDDCFIWTSSGRLYRWSGIGQLINACHVAELPPPIFKIGKVCRVCAMEKMRILGYSRSLVSSYIGKHFEIISYDNTQIPNDDEKAIYMGDGDVRNVKCKDWFGNQYILPELLLVPTSIKDIVKYEYAQQIERTVQTLKDTAKYDIERLSDEYQTSLRAFMNSSNLLQQKLTADFTQEAEKIIDTQMNLKKILEKNTQIADIEYEFGQKLTVITTPLFIDTLPIGKYKIIIDLNSRALRIYNLDISDEYTYQHPHIQARGQCCLGERVNPLRESYAKSDYVTLIGGIISYLESLNPNSVFTSMDSRQQHHYSKFKYSLQQQPVVEQVLEEVLFT